MLGGDASDGSKEKNGEANFDHRSGTEVIFLCHMKRGLFCF